MDSPDSATSVGYSPYSGLSVVFVHRYEMGPPDQALYLMVIEAGLTIALFVSKNQDKMSDQEVNKKNRCGNTVGNFATPIAWYLLVAKRRTELDFELTIQRTVNAIYGLAFVVKCLCFFI